MDSPLCARNDRAVPCMCGLLQEAGGGRLACGAGCFVSLGIPHGDGFLRFFYDDGKLVALLYRPSVCDRGFLRVPPSSQQEENGEPLREMTPEIPGWRRREKFWKKKGMIMPILLFIWRDPFRY